VLGEEGDAKMKERVADTFQRLFNGVKIDGELDNETYEKFESNFVKVVPVLRGLRSNNN